MKKLGLLLVGLLLMTGCTSKEKTLTCTLQTRDVISQYVLDSTYTVYSKNGVALRAVTEETVTSENNKILDYFEDTLKTSYSTMNTTYGGYQYTIDRNGQKIVSKVKIDYQIMDLKTYLKDQPQLKNYATNKGDLKLDGLRAVYESTGATCTIK